MEEMKRKVREEEWSEERNNIKALLIEKVKAAYPVTDEAQVSKHPLRFTLINSLTRLTDSLTLGFEDQMRELKKKIVKITEALSCNQILESSGLTERESYKEVEKLKGECSLKLEALLKLERELGPEENYKLAVECGVLENKAEELGGKLKEKVN